MSLTRTSRHVRSLHRWVPTRVLLPSRQSTLAPGRSRLGTFYRRRTRYAVAATTKRPSVRLGPLRPPLFWHNRWLVLRSCNLRGADAPSRFLGAFFCAGQPFLLSAFLLLLLSVTSVQREMSRCCQDFGTAPVS